MEGINNKIKLILLQGYRFPKFDNLRSGLLASQIKTIYSNSLGS